MKFFFTILNFLFFFSIANAQQGEIAGKVVDENGEKISAVNVVLVDSTFKSRGKGTAADYDGNYSIKNLTSGKYNVQFSLTDYQTAIYTNVRVDSEKTTLLDVKLKHYIIEETDNSYWKKNRHRKSK